MNPSVGLPENGTEKIKEQGKLCVPVQPDSISLLKIVYVINCPAQEYGNQSVMAEETVKWANQITT